MTLNQQSIALILTFLLLSCKDSMPKEKELNKELERPNVILVMTDDQGIGDLACHGNPWIKTPNLDKFYEGSVRLTDFHVSPMCTPTRSAIMTGLYPINNGVWATYKGRDMLHPSTVIMPEVFKENGYATALFGKWHLGNNYPSRPTDRGFELAVHHNSGGVGELSDYWGNNYFDDTYLVNNEPKEFEGYCTDVWFNEAIKFIKTKKEEPFFVYLPTNAPHSPLYVEDRYAAPYDSLVNTKIPNSRFYGMIANIDENFGKLDKALKEFGLEDNTIVIFMSDNGSQFGVSEDYSLGWNKGFRGRKGQKLEGGHRVPFFIRWPNGAIEGGRDISELSSHVDLLPTLAGLCNLDIPDDFQGDGSDISGLLVNKEDNIEDRTQFVHHRQDYRQPKPLEGSCIMKGDWRLLNGTTLYNIKLDPKQLKDVAKEHPEIMADLLEHNKKLIANSIQRKEYKEFAYTQVGSEHQQRATLTIQHAIGEDGPIWQPEQIAHGIKNKNAMHPLAVTQKGTYKISCMRWPIECSGNIQGVPAVNPKNQFEYRSIKPEKAKITLFDQSYEKKILANEDKVVFEIELEPGKTMLKSQFIEGNEEYGVYYTYVELIH